MDEDLSAEAMIRAAWLYYMEGLTQDAVAARLGTTRLRVNRLLADARSSGLVGITINARLASCLALEDRLRGDWGLQNAVIVPTPADEAMVPVLLGRATAEFLDAHLAAHSARGLGIGWGATLRETIRFVKPGKRESLNVNSMMGGLTRGLEINTFETASALAVRLGARCTYLAAPLYAGSEKSRDVLMAQDIFSDSLEQMRRNDIALLSVGDLSARSLLVHYGLPKDVRISTLKAAGATGDILGRFLDADGHPVDHPLNRRVISAPIEALQDIRTVVVASGGAHKAPILASVLRGRHANVIVSDEGTMLEALRIAGRG